MFGNTRPPAVAGMFYPQDPQELQLAVSHYLNTSTIQAEAVPKAIIAPHAGYIYSGPIAGNAYKSIEAARDKISKVILLGPAHRVPFLGIAASSADYFATPLGKIPIDKQIIEQLLNCGSISLLDQAHESEHSLEVQLPFLQQLLNNFSIVPLVVGNTDPQNISLLLELVWGGPETLIVISSDLSHYLNYAECQTIDEQTASAIEHLQPESIGFDQACGRLPINGLLILAKKKGLRVERVDLRNSGDTAGPKDQVVGYGAFWFY